MVAGDGTSSAAWTPAAPGTAGLGPAASGLAASGLIDDAAALGVAVAAAAVALASPPARDLPVWPQVPALPAGLPPDHLARLLHAVVEACPVSITIADLRDPAQPLRYVNPAFSSLSGWAVADAIGRNCRILQGPDTDPAHVRRLRDAIADRQPICIDVVNHRRCGTPFLNRLRLAPVIDLAAGIDAYVGLQHDVTAERAAELARREREKLEALGHMAGGFAHELNNLLQPIVSFADLLAMRLPQGVAPGDPDAAEQLAAITDGARAAREIASKVLHFARRSTADGLPAPAGARIGDAVRFASRLLPAGVTLATEGLDGLEEPLRIDPTELVQVLGNLFRNAADAMAGRGRITLSAATRDGQLLLDIADTGPGMDAATARRAFEPFFTTKPMGQGTGLGLSAVWGLVRGWGAAITLHTAPGQGARFRIAVPLATTPVFDIPPEA